MAEIKRDPITFEDGEGNEFIVFDQGHSHADIVRYVVEDVGSDEAHEILDIIDREAAERKPEPPTV